MDVEQRKSLLWFLGYYRGRMGGEWEDEAKRAAEAFQLYHGLTASGTVTPELDKRIIEAVCNGELAPRLEEQ